MKNSSEERVAIIIPVFNQLERTRECLESLFADPLRTSYEVIVINNNTNLGVAPAWNQGIRATSAPWLAILNNDIVLPPGWWLGLRDSFQKFSLQLASPFVLEGEKPQNLHSWSQRFITKNKKTFWREYSFVAFACRRELVDRIGPFDEGFLVGGFEDTDYIYRLRQKALSYGVVGCSAIYHYGSSTLKEFKKTGDAHAVHNLHYFQTKWQVDPREEYLHWKKRMEIRWRRWKLKFGYM